MKKNTKIIIGLASIVLLASLILIIVLVNRDKEPSLEKQFSDMVVDYYENDYKKFNPNTLKQLKELRIDLDAIKGYEKDVSVFEEHNCNMADTYATLTYKDDTSYDIDVHLACEEE